MAQSQKVTAYKWSIEFQSSFGLALVWFLVSYADIRQRWYPLVLTPMYVLITLIHAFSRFGINFRHISALKYQLPWGERMVQADDRFRSPMAVFR